MKPITTMSFLLSFCMMVISLPLVAEQEYVLGASVGRHITQLGIFAVQHNHPTLVQTFVYKTEVIHNFTDFIQQELAHIKTEYGYTIQCACFGVPGNANADHTFIQSPHLSFPVDGQEIMQHGILQKALVLNDFEIQAFGIYAVQEEHIIQINKGVERSMASKALVGAGAGLGSAFMVWNNAQKQYDVLPLGACFMDFAPHTQTELEFMEYLKKRTEQQKCSWGNVLGSTGGILAVYDFVGIHAYNNSYELLNEVDTIFNNVATSCVCKDAVTMYMTLYARLLRTMAYAVLPYGGLYITNSIAQEHSAWFIAPEFIEEYFKCNHPWLINMLSEIPVYIITDANIGLYGAAQYALRQ